MKHRHPTWLTVLTVAALLGVPAYTHAQDDDEPEAENQLINVLPGLIGGDAAADFNQAVVSQLSTFPLGSSAGGFTFSFNPATQTFGRSSDSFGPSFAERAMTMGAGTFNIGVTYQRATYDSVEGRNLKNGDIRFLVPNLPMQGDLTDNVLTVDLTTDTTVVFMTYGLTDRLDVGTAIPYIRVGLGATVSPTVVRRNGVPVPGGGVPLAPRSEEDSEAGIGDIMLRTKYNFLKREGGGASVMADITLPTGNSEDLIGTGAPRAKFLFVTSTTLGRIAPHLNAGYTFVGESANGTIDTDDEYNYVAGIEATLTDRVTTSFDFIARTITNIGQLRLGPAPTAPPEGDTGDGGNQQLNRQPGDLNLRLGSVGLKWHIGGTWLLSTAVLFPLDDAGLTDELSWSFGFDWTR